MDIAVEMTRASVALATQRIKDNMIRIAEENWLPEHVRMLRALIVAADTDMDYQHAYEMANERVDGPELPTKWINKEKAKIVGNTIDNQDLLEEQDGR